MKLFGYSISLNVIILIGILYLIMVVNALSSSCNREGYVLPSDRDNLVDLMKDINDAQDVNAPPITKPMIDGFVERLKVLKPLAYQDRRLIKPISDISTEIKKLYRLILQPSPSPILPQSQLMQTKYNSAKQFAITKHGLAKAAQAAAQAAQAEAQAAQVEAQAAQVASDNAQDAQYDALQ